MCESSTQTANHFQFACRAQTPGEELTGVFSVAAPSGCTSPALHLPGRWVRLQMGVLHPSPEHRVCLEVSVHHLIPVSLTPCTWGKSHSITSGEEKWGNVPRKSIYSERFFMWFSWFGFLCGCFAFFPSRASFLLGDLLLSDPCGTQEGSGRAEDPRVHIGGCPAPLGHPNGEMMGCISCSSSLSGLMDEYP